MCEVNERKRRKGEVGLEGRTGTGIFFFKFVSFSQTLVKQHQRKFRM